MRQPHFFIVKEYGIMKFFEDNLNKDGLPLQKSITDEINGIIGKIYIRVEDDYLILNSFPNIAFKITLFNFASSSWTNGLLNILIIRNLIFFSCIIYEKEY
jgi:hypothetical protein